MGLYIFRKPSENGGNCSPSSNERFMRDESRMFHIPKKESTVYILGAHLVFSLYQRPCRFSTWINGFGFNVQFKVKIVSGDCIQRSCFSST